MNDQNHPGMNQKSGRVSNKLGHSSKTDVRFWQDHLFRETYRNKGRLCQTSHWSARIQHEGRRERFPLYTPNRAAAAAWARDIYLFLVANGWEAVLARYRKPKTSVHDPEQPVTVGSFLNAIFSVCTNRSTIEGYNGLAADPAKFDYQSGGRDQWLAKIHGVELSKITPENPGIEAIIPRSDRGRPACSSQGADLREHTSPAIAQPLFAKGPPATATQTPLSTCLSMASNSNPARA
jgi:hypothetical protein